MIVIEERQVDAVVAVTNSELDLDALRPDLAEVLERHEISLDAVRIEKTALARHSSRMFLAGANVQVPFLKIILRKAYSLGAIAMSGGADDAAVFTVSWPTGEFGPMALEGAARLGYRNELAAIAAPVERKKRFDDMVAGLYQRDTALNVATHFAIDDVIEPADSRRWIVNSLRSTPVVTRRTVKKYPFVDCW